MNHARSSLHEDVPPVMSHDHERRGKSGGEPSNLSGFSPNSLDSQPSSEWVRSLIFAHQKRPWSHFAMVLTRLEDSWDHAILLWRLGIPREGTVMIWGKFGHVWSLAHLEFSRGPHDPHAYALLTESKNLVCFSGGVQLPLFRNLLLDDHRKGNAWVVSYVSSLPKTHISRLTSPYWALMDKGWLLISVHVQSVKLFEATNYSTTVLRQLESQYETTRWE